MKNQSLASCSCSYTSLRPPGPQGPPGETPGLPISSSLPADAPVPLLFCRESPTDRAEDSARLPAPMNTWFKLH
ncbi:hypothetical protein Y1Q_0015194 [Alligator mississippiensis]|uniref:Uncharacterized protein n=1 Tax=Alligator mississippiensis TaxID=8496 RepID=A0A151P9X6_ALLMI|nr:hypothetical protein Y1Q_0015194 [Alligator mississippiensis]